MYEHDHPPTAILGVTVKFLVALLVFLLTLFVGTDRLGLIRTVTERLSSLLAGKTAVHNGAGPDGTELIVTPEMLSEAIREVEIENLEKLETGENIRPDDRFYYIVELTGGGDLEAFQVEITPDAVTLSSAEGISTTLPRTAVKKISRYRLPRSEP